MVSFVNRQTKLELLNNCLRLLRSEEAFVSKVRSLLVSRVEVYVSEALSLLVSRMGASHSEVQIWPSSESSEKEAFYREIQSLLVSRMGASRSEVQIWLSSESSEKEAFYREIQSLFSSRMESFYREIKKCRRIISNLITMINRLPFNWLLSYIILAFHRDRHSPRYTSTTDEDSSASYHFLLSNCGAARGMLGLSSHS